MNIGRSAEGVVNAVANESHVVTQQRLGPGAQNGSGFYVRSFFREPLDGSCVSIEDNLFYNGVIDGIDTPHDVRFAGISYFDARGIPVDFDLFPSIPKGTRITRITDRFAEESDSARSGFVVERKDGYYRNDKIGYVDQRSADAIKIREAERVKDLNSFRIVGDPEKITKKVTINHLTERRITKRRILRANETEPAQLETTVEGERVYELIAPITEAATMRTAGLENSDRKVAMLRWSVRTGGAVRMLLSKELGVVFCDTVELSNKVAVINALADALVKRLGPSINWPGTDNDDFHFNRVGFNG